MTSRRKRRLLKNIVYESTDETDLDDTVKTNKLHLYKIKLKNRIEKSNAKPTRGVQGNWYPETLLFMANSKKEAEEYAHQHVEGYKMYGITKARISRFQVERKVEIESIERIA